MANPWCAYREIISLNHASTTSSLVLLFVCFYNLIYRQSINCLFLKIGEIWSHTHTVQSGAVLRFLRPVGSGRVMSQSLLTQWNWLLFNICFQHRHLVIIHLVTIHSCRFRVDIFRRGTIVTPSLRRDASVVVNVVLETLSFNCSLFLFSFKSFCCFLSNALLRNRFEWLYSSVLISFYIFWKKGIFSKASSLTIFSTRYDSLRSLHLCVFFIFFLSWSYFSNFFSSYAWKTKAHPWYPLDILVKSKVL